MNNLGLYQELEKLLRMESRYCSEDGVLLKNSIVESALALRPDLIKMLLSHEGLKNNFFAEVDGLLVFDKVKFQKFVMNKRFLADSYTSFKNKIGLTGDDDEFLSESREVVLSWPYKDCVLEGGQTKEDAKRNEVFWNEILAPDEINRLTEPKVLTGFKRYTADGAEEVKSVGKNDNLIIKGNNLLALHSLLKSYRNQVKLIYIDPPYNTGSDGFQYNDSFNHSSWLTFMRNRLTVARELLREDGVIFVQCDDNEQAYLKVLMDEIFVNRYINTISVKAKASAGASGGGEDKKLKKNVEYLIIYSKGDSFECFKDQYSIIPLSKYIDDNKEQGKNFAYTSVLVDEGKVEYYGETIDGRGEKIQIYKHTNYTIKSVSQLAKEAGEHVTNIYNKYIDKIFTLENAQTSIRERVLNATDADDTFYSIKYYPISGRNKGVETKVCFIGKTKRLVSFLKNTCTVEENEIYKKIKIGTLWDDLSWSSVFMEGNVSFSAGKKPEKLLSRIIDMATDQGDIVLDYHLGSGTTAAVAHKMGRRYIGVEQMDYIETVAVERLRKVIGTKKEGSMFGDEYDCDQGGISKAVNWKGGGEFVYCELAKANQNFVDSITQASTKEQLTEIWKQIEQTGFLSWKIDPKSIDEQAQSFDDLSVDDTKRFLIECLDKNLLYVPYSEIDNAEFAISAHDKSLNAMFYSK